MSGNKVTVFGKVQEVKADGFYTSSGGGNDSRDMKYALAADGWRWDCPTEEDEDKPQVWRKAAGKVVIPDAGWIEANVNLWFVFSKTHDEVVAWFKETEYGKMMEEVYGA